MPVHCPALSDKDDGDEGEPPHADTSTSAQHDAATPAAALDRHGVGVFLPLQFGGMLYQEAQSPTLGGYACGDGDAHPWKSEATKHNHAADRTQDAEREHQCACQCHSRTNGHTHLAGTDLRRTRSEEHTSELQ